MVGQDPSEVRQLGSHGGLTANYLLQIALVLIYLSSGIPFIRHGSAYRFGFAYPAICFRGELGDGFTSPERRMCKDCHLD